MGKWVFLIGLSAVCLSCGHVQKQDEPVAYDAVFTVVADAHSCTGLGHLQQIIDCLKYNLPESGPVFGTGFWVADDIVVTALHVAIFAEHDKDAHLVIRDPMGRMSRVKVYNWIYDPAIDLAFGVVRDPPKHETLTFCTEIYATERATAYGLVPDLGSWTERVRIRAEFDSNVYYIGNIRSGYSGGPVVSDVRKCVIAVTAGAYLQMKPVMGIGIPATLAQKILDIINASRIPKNRSKVPAQ